MPKKSLFSKTSPTLRAVEDISLDIKEGETFGLVGESGCGKSTFGRTLLQLYRPTSGEVLYFGGKGEKQGAGVDLTKVKGEKLRALRRDLQIIFQDPYASLNPRMTVGQLIGEGAITHGYFSKNSKQLQEYIAYLMQECGLQPHTLHRYPHQFSGGQRQRVCIARALALRPKFIVCDECVSALDLSVQSQILNLLISLKEKEKLTYLFISHDLSVVRYISDRIGVMYLGRIVELGKAEKVFSSPRHPYTVALVSAVPTLQKTKGKKILLSGNMPSPVFPPTGCPFHTRCFMSQEICKMQMPPLAETEKEHFCACHFAQKSTAEKRKIAYTAT